MSKLVSPRQLELLLDFMEEHTSLALGKVRGKEGSFMSRRLWHQISQCLNNESDGAQKTAYGWKRYYYQYKCRIKTKVRQIQQGVAGSESGSAYSLTMTPLEARLYGILGGSSSPLPIRGVPRTDAKTKQLRINLSEEVPQFSPDENERIKEDPLGNDTENSNIDNMHTISDVLSDTDNSIKEIDFSENYTDSELEVINHTQHQEELQKLEVSKAQKLIYIEQIREAKAKADLAELMLKQQLEKDQESMGFKRPKDETESLQRELLQLQKSIFIEQRREAKAKADLAEFRLNNERECGV